LIIVFGLFVTSGTGDIGASAFTTGLETTLKPPDKAVGDFE
jgi:hypothetical protein